MIDQKFMQTMFDPLFEMGGSNIIPVFGLTAEKKLGLYYVQEVFHLHFSVCSRADWMWIELKKGENEPALSGNEIMDMNPDLDVLTKHEADFKRGIFPKGYRQSKEAPVQKSEPTGKYGYLSPAGDFEESEWGTHEVAAEKIAERIGWDDRPDWDYDVYRDYLIQEKGYVLIHSPALAGIVVTSHKPLTKKQREFLYGYFTDLGDRMRAEMYLEGNEQWKNS